jgi:hypothetical protein
MKMKPAMPVMTTPVMTKTTTILVCALAASMALAQSPTIIQNTRSTMNGVSSRATAASNEALAAPPSAPANSTGASAMGAARANRPAVVPAKTIAAQPAPVGAKGTRLPKRGPGAVLAVPQPKVAAVPVADLKKHEKQIAAAPVAEGSETTEQSVVPDGTSRANGRRDPFISPVVSHATGSGCSTGKKCLEIGTINLRGVVRSENGFIAVVSNGLNKSYFLRENDPVFNGYVTKITGDSIVFQETLQDRVGKSFTREVIKKITVPAV